MTVNRYIGKEKIAHERMRGRTVTSPTVACAIAAATMRASKTR